MAGEFALIREFFQRDLKQDGAQGVALGIGDDCALLSPLSGQLAVSVDTLVSGIHFPETAAAYDIAQRALRTNLSDLAAMGAAPRWFTLALTLPESNEEWLRDFSRGLFDCADEYGITLVGGDTTKGALTITIQVMGEVPQGLALRRDGASPGDFIFVTNTLGDGAAALAVIQNKYYASPEHEQYLRERFYQPVPQLAAGLALRGIASAALDVSDGLLADLSHICRASDVGAIVDVENLPLSQALLSVFDLGEARVSALNGGDDYQLCFTVSPASMADIGLLIANQTLSATLIGQIIAGQGVSCELAGEPYEINRLGYEHF